MKGNLWTIAVLFIGLVVLLPAINIAFAESTQTATANETTAVDYSTPYTLGETAGEGYESLSVTANETELTNGTDYTFDPPNATVEWHDTNATSSGDDAFVNYTYAYYGETTTVVAGVLSTVPAWLGFVAVMATLGYLLMLIPGGSGW